MKSMPRCCGHRGRSVGPRHRAKFLTRATRNRRPSRRTRRFMDRFMVFGMCNELGWVCSVGSGRNICAQFFLRMRLVASRTLAPMRCDGEHIYIYIYTVCIVVVLTYRKCPNNMHASKKESGEKKRKGKKRREKEKRSSRRQRH